MVQDKTRYIFLFNNSGEHITTQKQVKITSNNKCRENVGDRKDNKFEFGFWMTFLNNPEIKVGLINKNQNPKISQRNQSLDIIVEFSFWQVRGYIVDTLYLYHLIVQVRIDNSEKTLWLELLPPKM